MNYQFYPCGNYTGGVEFCTYKLIMWLLRGLGILYKPIIRNVDAGLCSVYLYL